MKSERLAIHVINATPLADVPLKKIIRQIGSLLETKPKLFPPFEATLLVTSAKKIKALNYDYRGQNKATDVLSFPQLEPAQLKRAAALAKKAKATLYLGDIVLCMDVVKRAATKQKKALNHHLTHLVVHGLLHLLGYDHVTAARAKRMENLERSLLAELGIANPYAMEEVPSRTTKKIGGTKGRAK